MINPTLEKISEKIRKITEADIENKNSISKLIGEQEQIIILAEKEMNESASISDVNAFKVAKAKIQDAQTRIEMLNLKMNNESEESKRLASIGQLQSELLTVSKKEMEELKGKIQKSLEQTIHDCEEYAKYTNSLNALYDYIDSNITHEGIQYINDDAFNLFFSKIRYMNLQ